MHLTIADVGLRFCWVYGCDCF